MEPTPPPRPPFEKLKWANFFLHLATNTWTNLHGTVYRLLHECGGHVELVAGKIQLDESLVRDHYRCLKRALKNPRYKLWGYPDDRDLPVIAMCWYCFKFGLPNCSACPKQGKPYEAVTCGNVPVCR